MYFHFTVHTNQMHLANISSINCDTGLQVYSNERLGNEQRQTEFSICLTCTGTDTRHNHTHTPSLSIAQIFLHKYSWLCCALHITTVSTPDIWRHYTSNFIKMFSMCGKCSRRIMFIRTKVFHRLGWSIESSQTWNSIATPVRSHIVNVYSTLFDFGLLRFG